MEYHEELVEVDTLVEYHEEFVDVVTLVDLLGVFTLMECREVFGGRNDQHLLIGGRWDRRLMRV